MICSSQSVEDRAVTCWQQEFQHHSGKERLNSFEVESKFFNTLSSIIKRYLKEVGSCNISFKAGIPCDILKEASKISGYQFILLPKDIIMEINKDNVCYRYI